MQIDRDQAIAKQMSTAAEQDFVIKAAIKSTRATEWWHYTKLMNGEKMKLLESKKAFDAKTLITQVRIIYRISFLFIWFRIFSINI